MTIANNIFIINEKIKKACIKSNKKFEDIELIAVTKTIEIPLILEAINSGIKIVGESRIQESREKYPILKDKAKMHLIGHLQKNKVKEAVKMFDMIQSVDSFELAIVISEECVRQNRTMDILLEVKTSSDINKHGISINEVEDNLSKIIKLPNLQVKGLMTIADFTDDENKIRNCFIALRKIKENIKNIDLKYLSMGMTSDFKLAVEEGSNMLRIGSGIFQA